MSRPVAVGHPVIILARGYGSRLASVARGTHKALEVVGDQTILGRILRELESVTATELHLHLREPDPQATALTQQHPQPVHITARTPGGYLPDVADCARYGQRFTVIEADTITHPGSLRNFLLLADLLSEHADLCVGVAPTIANPNGPSVIVNNHGLVEAISWTAQPSGLVPLSAWHWHADMLAHAHTFAARSTSVADYVTWAIPRGARVVPIGFPAGRNINTPEDLTQAHHHITAWTTRQERSIAA